jgi:glycosyltransferase involved in cell wall biosynthesis
VYIRRDALQEIGYFDAEKYGMGYGEESDFGMRAVRAGYKNLISCKTYIYHLEGQSFGREGKKEIQREKRKILVADYPEVEELEREFHRRDPLKDIRRVMPFFKKYPELLQVPIAIQIGSIEENKGQVDIIRALAELQDGTPELHIIFVGKVADDNYKRQLDELISKYKLTHRVHFFGYVREPWALIKLAEIVVVSSRSEGLGRVAMEGMYFAKPIISTQVGGLVELLNESNSFSYPPGNSKQLAVHLTRLLGDKQLRNRLGGQAKKDITMLLSKQNYAEDITGIIKELIGKQNSQLGLTSFLSPWFLGEVMDSSVLGFILDKGYRRVRYQLRPIRKRIRKAQKKYMFRTRVKRFLGLVR